MILIVYFSYSVYLGKTGLFGGDLKQSRAADKLWATHKPIAHYSPVKGASFPF